MRNFYLLKTTIIFLSISLSTTSTAQEPHLLLTPVISGLSIPVQVLNAGDGSNRLFVVMQGSSQKSSVVAYDQSFNKIDTFLRITRIRTGGEEGLLSMAFHPEYGNAASPFFGFFYVYYTNSAGNLEIARYNVGANPNVADTTTKDTVLTIPHPTFTNHNGGTLQFGNDGYLYLATGDGGDGGDPPNNAQNPNVLLGKMLRIDVNNSSTAPFYSIPPTNPHVGVTMPADTLDAIYAFGLRNPFRWSFDRLTDDMWIGDVGQGSWEEINFRPADSTARANYGWRCYEGNANYNTSGCRPRSFYNFPVHEYENPAEGRAVTGGVVYRGSLPANAALVGYYLAAEYYLGHILKIRRNGSGWTVYRQDAVRTGISSFGESEDGEIYVVSQSGTTISHITVDAILPARLISFNALVINGSVKLNWKTSFEETLDRFEIQYSSDGLNFEQAGFVTALNSISGADYSFLHQPPSRGRAIYRLKMKDIDGQFEYSNIVSVQLDRPVMNFVQPSIVNSGIINVYLPEQFHSLELINMNGSILVRQNIRGRSGRMDISLPFVTTGSYIVQLRNNETTLRQRIFIQQ